MEEMWMFKFRTDPIARFLALKHKKKWEIKKINKRLAGNGLRTIRA